jgi:uncharacterized OsmC-like protein
MRPITVTWDGGLRFTAGIRGHHVTVDQPIEAGGEDSCPMPIELLPASLGTCVALFVKQFLAARDLDPTGLVVEVSSQAATSPHRISRFEVDVIIPAGVPAKYQDAVRRAAEACTVHHTLTHAPEITVSIVEGAAVSKTQ